jgi:transcriptional repressor NrdR
MRCPFCKAADTRVIDSRVIEDGKVIKRRRVCDECGSRFNTYERIENIPIVVIKNNGAKELFEKEKVIKGIVKAINKRPLTYDDAQKIANDIEDYIKAKELYEISSKEIGNLVIDALKKLDQVSYVRFASVYKKFADAEDFIELLKEFNNVK